MKIGAILITLLIMFCVFAVLAKKRKNKQAQAMKEPEDKAETVDPTADEAESRQETAPLGLWGCIFMKISQAYQEKNTKAIEHAMTIVCYVTVTKRGINDEIVIDSDAFEKEIRTAAEMCDIKADHETEGLAIRLICAIAEFYRICSV